MIGRLRHLRDVGTGVERVADERLARPTHAAGDVEAQGGATERMLRPLFERTQEEQIAVTMIPAFASWMHSKVTEPERVLCRVAGGSRAGAPVVPKS